MPAASTWATKAEVDGGVAVADAAGAAVWAVATGVGAVVVTGDADGSPGCGVVAVLTEWVAETGDADSADGLEGHRSATGPSVKTRTPAATAATTPAGKP
jgi:hypothetical protein